MKQPLSPEHMYPWLPPQMWHRLSEGCRRSSGQHEATGSGLGFLFAEPVFTPVRWEGRLMS